jgi:hypothetical protein
MRDIVIIGAGGFGREIAWLIEDINKNKKEWNVVGFVDDDLSKQGECFNGYQVVGDIEWLKDKELFAVCAIGDPLVKRETISRLHGKKKGDGVNRGYLCQVNPQKMGLHAKDGLDTPDAIEKMRLTLYQLQYFQLTSRTHFSGGDPQDAGGLTDQQVDRAHVQVE